MDGLVHSTCATGWCVLMEDEAKAETPNSGVHWFTKDITKVCASGSFEDHLERKTHLQAKPSTGAIATQGPVSMAFQIAVGQ